VGLRFLVGVDSFDDHTKPAVEIDRLSNQYGGIATTIMPAPFWSEDRVGSDRIRMAGLRPHSFIGVPLPFPEVGSDRISAAGLRQSDPVRSVVVPYGRK